MMMAKLSSGRRIPLFIFQNFSKANGVHEINEKIGKLLADAEKMGMEGEVEKSQEVIEMMFMARKFNLFKIMKEVEALKDEKRNAEQSYRNSMPRNHFQKRHCNVKNIILMQKMSL